MANANPHIGRIIPEAAPRLRERRWPRGKRPEIKLSERQEESRFVGALPLGIGLIALAATLGFAHLVRSRTDDPNYLKAKDSLFQYESGLSEIEKNYDSPIYGEALALLAKVDSGSISAEKAEALSADITFKTDAFHRRIQARTEAELATQNALLVRDQEYLANRERSLTMPQKKKWPECNEGKDGHAH